MVLTSAKFLLFIAITIVIYYVLPKRLQWVVLLAASGYFYLCAGIKTSFYVLITASSIYFAARCMDLLARRRDEYLSMMRGKLPSEEKKRYAANEKRKRKYVMLFALLLNLGILGTFKYTNFLFIQMDRVFRIVGVEHTFKPIDWIVPLGISFYTFQAIGYLLDVYWENIECEKNYFKFLLFVSFFPQMTQGPISDFGQLAPELFKEHVFSYDKYAGGFRRMLWGFFKKMLVADVFGVFVQTVFANYHDYSGITTMLGAFCYSIQIYADFSGYMDIMCGLCEILGIELRENFDRPYFSKSIAEYWRRWHISLGDWFKKYIYYPIGMSSWSRKLAKKIKKKMGKYFANSIPATIALMATWFATGLWHGANWAYIIWGLVNGAFIIFSIWMEPVYARLKGFLHIKEDSKGYSLFQILRTFLLVTLIKVFPEVGDFTEGCDFIKHIFTDHRLPQAMDEIVPFVKMEYHFILVAVVGVCLMFIVSCMQEKETMRIKIEKLPVLVRIVLVSLSIILIVSLGNSFIYHYGGGGFLYAGF